MSYLFQYAVLRYRHDAVTQEFVNIGVLLFSPEQNYLGLRISHKYKRVSQLFNGIDSLAFRRFRRMVEKAAKRVAEGLAQNKLFEAKINNIEQLLPRILPENDSALSFAMISEGITDDLEEELNYLHSRLVEFYISGSERNSRTDEEIWVEYVKAFKKRDILPYLTEVTIPTQTFNYKFDRAFKNQRWHPVEPVSFDLSTSNYIQDKAARWIGKAVILSTSPQIGTLYILSGKPNNPNLLPAYEAAKRGLEENTQGIEVRVIDEEYADDFSAEFASFIHKHIA